MSTMTLSTPVERAQPRHTRAASHMMPLMLAMVFLVATIVASVLISGPLH